LRFRARRAEAEAAGDQDEVARVEGEIEALETALRKRPGKADTGERAYDNVRKAFRIVMKQLRKGGPEERAFAEHLRTHLSIGLECMYSQPQGRIWA
jgi:intergrase/recombinase